MKASNIKTHYNFWANSLIIIGFLGFAIFSFLIYQRLNPQNLSFNVNPADSNYRVSQSETVQPIGLIISSANITLPIIPAKLEGKKWQSSTEGVSYLDSSVFPGEVGNSIMYGHNWPNLLGNLKNTKPGDRIKIYYADNSTKDFLIEYKAEVKPSDISILENSTDRRITLYTCSGFLDSLRLVVVAKLLS